MTSTPTHTSGDLALPQIRAYYAAVDAQDLEALLATFSPDATYRRPGYEPLVGRDAIRAFYENDRVIDSGAHTLTDIVRDGERSAVAGRFQGTLKDGQVMDFRFADFFTHAADGRFATRETFFFTKLA